MKWIWNFWRPHHNWLWILSLLTLISSAVILLQPYFYGVVIDTASRLAGEPAGVKGSYPAFAQSLILHLNNWIGIPDPANVGKITKKIITLLIIAGLLRSVSRFYPRVRMLINNLLAMDMREYYFAQVIGKGYRFFTRFRTGDLVTRLTDDIDSEPKISWFACSGIFRAIESGSQFAFCVGIMLILNWKLALISISTLPLLLYIFYKLRSRLTDVSLQRQELISATNDALEAAYSGIRILKAFNVENGQSMSFKSTLSKRLQKEYQYQQLDYRVKFIYQGISNLGQIIVFTVGGWMVLNHGLSEGVFYSFWVYLAMLLPLLTDIPYLFVASRTAFASIDREIEIETTPGGTENIYTGTEKAGATESIEIRDASFRYSDNLPQVLDKVGIKLSKGEKAAVVGPVGGGKSTLIKLAAGLYPPSSGEFLFNSRGLVHYDIDSYRERIGYIPQEATLFSESVRDNVRFGRDIPDYEILNALEMAQIRDEVEAMPEGLNQMLGQRGLTLSGGQKQRVAIARALAGKPDLLLMDDCTSSLDAENESRFWETFTEKYPDTACLIVTHRLSTARKADVIYVLDHGKLVGKGTHEELLESCEEYRNFLTRDELMQALAVKKSNHNA